MPEQDTLPCPGCHTPLTPEATGCQICMRPRSKQEIVRGYAKLREEKARKRRLPFKILAAALVLGVAGKIYVDHGAALKASAGKAYRAAARWTDEMRDPNNYASKPAPRPPEAPAAPAAPGAPVAPEDALRTQLFPSDPEPARAPSPTTAAAPDAPRRAGPKPLAKNSWRVSGTVYDLATLAPVQGADITFTRDEKEPATVTTDESGAYEIDLAKGEGWSVSMEAHDHRRGQILDIDPPYRVRDADERRAALEHISDGDLIAAPLDWKRSDSKVRLDLIAVPNFWTDARRR